MSSSMKRIWLSPPHMGDRELGYVQEAFATNWIAPLGPHVDAFEAALRAQTGTAAALALNSGTAALHLGLRVLGVQKDTVVLCQSFTFAASAFPILYEGAVPVFIDSEPGTWNMDPQLLEQALEDCRQQGRTVSAVVVVDLYGMPARINDIAAICDRYQVPLLEDAAEALGSSYQGQPCGSFGRLGVLSFNGNKIITTSGGGALIGNDTALVEAARFLSTQAKDPFPHYEHSKIGFNYRMSNVTAGIGRGQLEVLSNRVDSRRRNFQFYQEQLGDLPGVYFPPEPAGCFSNRWLTTILVDPQVSGGVDRERIRLCLEAEHIESRPLWKPMHLQPVFAGCTAYVNGVSGRLFEQGLCLPSGSALQPDDLHRICSLIKSCWHA